MDRIDTKIVEIPIFEILAKTLIIILNIHDLGGYFILKSSHMAMATIDLSDKKIKNPLFWALCNVE